jgi:putative acetyltransferase
MTARASIRIRQFRIADYGATYALWRRTEGIGLNESDTREAIRSFLNRNPGFSRVACVRGRVIATVLCGHDGRRGYLHHLAVDRRWRRHGIARRLVDACLDHLAAEGIAKCNLFLFGHNVAGRAFWRHLDWDLRADLRVMQRRTAGPPACSRTSC